MSMTNFLKRSSMVAVGAACIALGVGGAAEATVLTFDNITTNSLRIISDGYGGFDWTNFYVINGSYVPNTGYDNGTVSGNNTAFNGFARPVTVNSDSVFDFNGAYLTAAWNTGLNILVQGFSGGALQESKTVTVNTDAPTWFDFDFLGIDSLKFTSFGGFDAKWYDYGWGTHFAMDNFTFNETENAESVPEPTSLLGFLTIGALGATSALKRKKQEV
ncbi:MAG: PEP-CTERM sorting domain-containing protein [Symploca sp. SIO2B6]|nr:PEP-CTERM sorting domain-containing protein [Symploca sp. SIO2B6]